MKNTIHKGDCLELMKQIPDGSVDMILCDLPYGTTACKWDVIIPFEPLWEQYKRIIKSNGAIVLTASQPFTSALVMSNPKMFRYEWIWEKDRASAFLDANKKPLKAHENILVFGEILPKYFPIKTINNKPSNVNGKAKGEHIKELLRGGIEHRIGGGKTDRFPRSVYKCNVPNHGEFGLHPTQKPVALFEYLIKTYTNEGETVLDNCAGSGTTAIACLNTNRNYILMEKEDKYFEMIENRIAKWHSEREPKGLFKTAI